AARGDALVDHDPRRELRPPDGASEAVGRLVDEVRLAVRNRGVAARDDDDPARRRGVGDEETVLEVELDEDRVELVVAGGPLAVDLEEEVRLRRRAPDDHESTGNGRPRTWLSRSRVFP